MNANDLKALHDEALKGPHLTADRETVTEGTWYWDNNPSPLKVTRVGYFAEGEPDGPLGIVVWHHTTRGSSDGSRLWRWFPAPVGHMGNTVPRMGETPEAWAARTGVNLDDVRESPLITAVRANPR